MQLLQHDIRWDFQENVRNEEQKQSDVEIGAVHIEVFLESLNPGIADVDAAIFFSDVAEESRP